MPEFGSRSLRNLDEAHPLLQKVFREVIKDYDCAIIEGHRSEEAQNAAYHSGKSKLAWPLSKHNKKPALAVDVIPWPVDWEDTKRFYHFAGYVKGIARGMGIGLRWGGDWDSDNDLNDQTFFDLVHFELR